MQVVARERLVAALGAEDQYPLQLAAVAQRKDVAVAALEQPPRHVARLRQARLVQHQRPFGRHGTEIDDGRAPRDRRFRLVDDQGGTLARKEVHLLQPERGAETLAHHGDQLVYVVEGGQLLRELRHRAAVFVAVAVDEALDDRLHPPFHRDEHAGDQ